MKYLFSRTGNFALTTFFFLLGMWPLYDMLYGHFYTGLTKDSLPTIVFVLFGLACICAYRGLFRSSNCVDLTKGEKNATQ